MTGKDLIVYILQNNLENEMIFQDGAFIGFLNEEEVAAKFKVGLETIRVWQSRGMLKGFTFGDSVYFRKDVSDPRNSLTIY